MALLANLSPVGENSTRMSEIGNLAILPMCDADVRCNMWLGPLNNVSTIGCGINVLRFMSEIDNPNANQGLQEAMSGSGTPFQHIVNWFNLKSRNLLLNKNYYEGIYDISSIANLSSFFQGIKSALVNNSCILVKLNRNDDPALRPPGLTPGHYILLHKDSNGELYTYEPIYSNPGNCNKRIFNGVSQNFFRVYNQQGYITASILEVQQIQNPNPMQIDDGSSPMEIDEGPDMMEIDDGSSPMEIDGGGRPDNIYLIDDTIVDLFTQDLLTCEKQIAGKKRKTNKRKTNKRKTNKRKTNKRKTNKRKTNKRKTNKRN
jgi:hypothetical protein